MQESRLQMIETDMVFEMSVEKPTDTLPLKTYEWAIITQLNGEKTVGQIGEILSLTSEETKAYFDRLTAYGLLKLVGKPLEQQPIPAEWFEELTYELTLAVGPVAEFIIEECLMEMRRSQRNLEQNLFITLVDWVSREISNENRRYEFLRKLIGFINHHQQELKSRK